MDTNVRKIVSWRRKRNLAFMIIGFILWCIFIIPYMWNMLESPNTEIDRAGFNFLRVFVMMIIHAIICLLGWGIYELCGVLPYWFGEKYKKFKLWINGY